jgi:hypothetical protein
MLQHLPRAVGTLLHNIPAGDEKLLIHAEELNAPLSIQVESPAFRDAQQIPPRYTAYERAFLHRCAGQALHSAPNQWRSLSRTPTRRK